MSQPVHQDGGPKADFVDFEEKFPREFENKSPKIDKPSTTKISGPMQDWK
jgi:hypothetical protein